VVPSLDALVFLPRRRGGVFRLTFLVSLLFLLSFFNSPRDSASCLVMIVFFPLPKSKRSTTCTCFRAFLSPPHPPLSSTRRVPRYLSARRTPPVTKRHPLYTHVNLSFRLAVAPPPPPPLPLLQTLHPVVALPPIPAIDSLFISRTPGVHGYPLSSSCPPPPDSPSSIRFPQSLSTYPTCRYRGRSSRNYLHLLPSLDLLPDLKLEIVLHNSGSPYFFSFPVERPLKLPPFSGEPSRALAPLSFSKTCRRGLATTGFVPVPFSFAPVRPALPNSLRFLYSRPCRCADLHRGVSVSSPPPYLLPSSLPLYSCRAALISKVGLLFCSRL